MISQLCSLKTLFDGQVSANQSDQVPPLCIILEAANRFGKAGSTIIAPILTSLDVTITIVFG